LDTIDIIKEIETTYDVESIEVNGIQIWPFLRSIYFGFIDKTNLNVEYYKKITKNEKLFRFKNVFYGLGAISRKYDYVIFSDTMERRLCNGKYINKIFETLIEELGHDNILLIENAAYGTHYPKSVISTKNIISLELFRFFWYLNPLKLNLIKIKNKNILDQINEKYSINIEYNKLIIKFIFFKKLFGIFFSIYKPKIMLISSYYDIIYQAAIYSANKKGVKTIEFQHGIINEEHYAYNIFGDFNRMFFPKYLFVFGKSTKKVFGKNNKFIDKNNVFPVGYMYLDYIDYSYRPNEDIITLFENFKEKYTKIVSISSQIGLEDDIINFLKKASEYDKRILYIFIPRNQNKDYSCYAFPSNIITLNKLNVYETIKYSDFHVTVNSSCAIEAPALGVPNILINIKNESKRYYSKILTNPEVTRFVDTPEEFVNLIQNWAPKSKEEIKQLHEGFYTKNHKESLKKALDKILNDTKL